MPKRLRSDRPTEKSQGPIIDLFGDSARTRIWNFLTIYGGSSEYSMSEIARNSYVSWRAFNRVWPEIVKSGVLIERREGQSRLYKLNTNNPLAKLIVRIADETALQAAIASLPAEERPPLIPPLRVQSKTSVPRLEYSQRGFAMTAALASSHGPQKELNPSNLWLMFEKAVNNAAREAVAETTSEWRDRTIKEITEHLLHKDLRPVRELMDECQETANLRDRQREILKILNAVTTLERDTGTVQASKLFEQLSVKSGLSENDSRSIVNQLVREGILYSPEPGQLKRAEY